MRRFTSSNRFVVAAAFSAIAVCIGGAAHAHVTLDAGEAKPGSYYRGALKIPHGCNGEATRSIRVQIPEGVIGVKPMPKPGWTLTTQKGAYAKSYESHGKPVTEGVKEITWSGGELADEFYDEFVFTGFVTADFSAGQQVYFPTVQACTKGEARWTEIPAKGQSAHDLKSPAPSLRMISDPRLAAQAAGAGSDTYTIGNLTIASPWSRATPGGAKIAGGYLKITNSGSTPDRLVSAVTSAAGKVEIHEMSMTNGVMQMRPLNEGLPIKAGETVELKPGGFHMMFMDLTQPFKQGEAVKTTLQFEKAGKIDVMFNVGDIGATNNSSSEHKHH